MHYIGNHLVWGILHAKVVRAKANNIAHFFPKRLDIRFNLWWLIVSVDEHFDITFGFLNVYFRRINPKGPTPKHNYNTQK